MEALGRRSASRPHSGHARLALAIPKAAVRSSCLSGVEARQTKGRRGPAFVLELLWNFAPLKNENPRQRQ
jgi:hypothetical protein